jgi:hypothetical protein
MRLTEPALKCFNREPVILQINQQVKNLALLLNARHKKARLCELFNF